MSRVATTIIVPGFMGSNLVDADTGRAVWNNWTIPWIDLRRLRLIDSGRGAGGAYGVTAAGDLWPVYRPLLRRLRGIGHRGVFFAFDWRQPIEHAVERLEALVASLECRGRLNIITHSMGGLVAARWLADGGVNRLGEEGRVVCISLPAAGVAMALNALVAGFSLLAVFNVRSSRRLIKELAWETPPLYEMLPPLPGIFRRENWPDNLRISERLLSNAESFRARLESSLPVLARLAQEGRAALIAGSGHRTRLILPSADLTDAANPEQSNIRDGDGWVLAESVRVSGVPTYLFRCAPGDGARLGLLWPLVAAMGSHSLLPMFKRVGRATLDFLGEGAIRTLPLRDDQSP